MRDGMSDGLLKKKQKAKRTVWPSAARRWRLRSHRVSLHYFEKDENILLNLKFEYDLRILNLGLIEYRPPTATLAATTNHIA